jgi:hypothetical protein
MSWKSLLPSLLLLWRLIDEREDRAFSAGGDFAKKRNERPFDFFLLGLVKSVLFYDSTLVSFSYNFFVD